MPKKSPFSFSLTLQERRSLEAITRKYTSPYCDIIRAKIALLAAEGMENKQIAQRLDLPRQIVSKWRKRFFEQRLCGLQERPRRGRSRTFPP
jgi:transposase-like protein